MRYILLEAVYYFFNVLDIAILVYCIGSWFVRPGSKLFDLWRKLGYYLEPLFRPAKILISKLKFMRNVPVDFSPWLTCILLGLVYRLIFVLLF